MQSLSQILGLFFSIATLKRPPQDLPATQSVLVIGVGLSLTVSLVRYFILGRETYSVFQVFLEVAVPALLVYLLLMFFKLPQRFLQSFSALCGTTALIHVLALPILPALYDALGSNNPIIYIVLILDMWWVIVVAHILKHTLNVHFGTGISLAIGLGLASMLIVENFAPTSVAT